LSRDETDAAARSCETHDHRADALIEILHDIQSARGHVSDEDVQLIATNLNLSRAEVHGVRSFYSDFSTKPRAHNRIRLCRAEACQSVGSEALAAELERRGLETEAVFCLGNCALGPAALLGETLIGRASADEVERVATEIGHE
jgi:formate dehydrogenase subunit gamma